jgi:hypothetical protein
MRRPSQRIVCAFSTPHIRECGHVVGFGQPQRVELVLPSPAIAAALGPMKFTPASSHNLLKDARSDRKP